MFGGGDTTESPTTPINSSPNGGDIESTIPPPPPGMNVKKILKDIWNDTTAEGTTLRWKAFGMLGLLGVINIGLIVLLCLVGIHYQTLLFNGFLAYSFGLRHAVDADHIAAIDNTVRKLVQEGKQPVAVGFFFSMGHSTIVFGLSCAIAFGTSVIPDVGNVVKTIGVSVSASFLILIGIFNLIIFINIVTTWRKVIRGQAGYDQEAMEEYLAKRGFMNRFCGAALRTISKSWHMYFLGLLFGLGFDTATEVALLAIAASASGEGLPAPLVLLLPFLFAAGMSFVDTLDGILMIWCYGWAFIHPVRKLYYNMTVTLVSVLIAFTIGILETLGILQNAYDLTGGFWNFIDSTQDANVSVYIGGSIIGIFCLSFLVSTYFYKYMRYDELIANPATFSETGEGESLNGEVSSAVSDDNEKKAPLLEQTKLDFSKSEEQQVATEIAETDSSSIPNSPEN